MKVLFFSLSPKSDLYSSLADEFCVNGNELTFVTPTETNTRLEDYHGFKILYFHSGKMLNVSIPRKGLSNLLFPSYCLHAVKKYINPKDYNLILMSTPPLGYLSSIKWIKKRNSSIKFYLILRDIHPEGATHILKKIPGLYGYFKRMASSLYELSDVVGCMTPLDVELVQKNYLYKSPYKVKLLANWGRKTDYNEPSTEIKKKYGLEDKYVIIYGGNMGKPQNLTLFLELAKQKQHLKDVLFLFIGSGTEREHLRDIVRINHIANVRIEDSIPQNDYNEILRCASVGIITLHPLSFFANCPSKAISYWQNKIPILASLDKITDFGTYFLDRSNSGLWSLATDFESLSNNFDILYKNREMRKEMGDNGFSFFNENYTVDKTYKEIMCSVYK